MGSLAGAVVEGGASVSDNAHRRWLSPTDAESPKARKNLLAGYRAVFQMDLKDQYKRLAKL